MFMLLISKFTSETAVTNLSDKLNEKDFSNAYENNFLIQWIIDFLRKRSEGEKAQQYHLCSAIIFHW